MDYGELTVMVNVPVLLLVSVVAEIVVDPAFLPRTVAFLGLYKSLSQVAMVRSPENHVNDSYVLGDKMACTFARPSTLIIRDEGENDMVGAAASAYS